MRQKRNPKLERLIKLQPDETYSLVVRKHWFVFVRAVFAVFLGTLFLWVAIGVILQVVKVDEALIRFWQAFVVLMGILSIFVIWTNYWLDMWIVTNKRVVHVDQKTLFSRTVIATRIDRVQDVKAKVSGIIATMLGFGDLQVQTAGASSANMFISGIPDPNNVRREILKRLDEAIAGYKNHDGVGHS